MSQYVDGYVLSVPSDKIEEYREMAAVQGADEVKMPFDVARMVYGGFEAIVEYQSEASDEMPIETPD